MEDFEFLDTIFLDFSVYEDLKKNEEQEEDVQEDQQCDLEEGCLTCGS